MFLNLIISRLQVALSVWHDEARGISRHQLPPEESIDIDDINSDEEEGQAGPSGSGKTSELPTRPPSSASDQTSGPENDFDMDGVLGSKPTRSQGAAGEFDFEVEMWDDTPFIDSTSTASVNPANPPANPPVPPLCQDEDQDMWDVVDELQAQATSSENTVPQEKPSVPVDDDDWDSMYA